MVKAVEKEQQPDTKTKNIYLYDEEECRVYSVLLITSISFQLRQV